MSVTLINPFEVSIDKENKCIELWNKAAEHLSKQEGFISTKLHKSISENPKFLYVNIAEWESPELFFKAIS